MTITKYTYHGKDAEHDILFIEKGHYLRFGSDEEPKPALKQAYRDLCRAAGEVAGFPVEVRRITWKRETKEVTAIIEGLAVAKNGGDMKIRLPEIGWRKVLVEKIPGALTEETFPIGTDEEGIYVLAAFDAALADYVRTGSGQLDLFTAEVPEVKEREVADRVLPFKG